MNIEKFGPTNGSSWRYIHRDEDGNGVSAHDQVLLGERLVFLMDVFKLAVSNKIKMTKDDDRLYRDLGDERTQF